MIKYDLYKNYLVDPGEQHKCNLTKYIKWEIFEEISWAL